MEKRHILNVTSIGCTILWLWAVIAFNKWDARWWGISVWFFAILGALAFIGIAGLLQILKPDETTPKVVLCCLGVFVAISLAEGVFISEPALHSQHATRQEASSSHDEGGSFFYYSWWHSSTTTSSSTSTSNSSKSKGAGYVVLILLLIGLLLLSAIVPHFWVVAVFIGAVLLWCFTVKEYRYYSDYY